MLKQRHSTSVLSSKTLSRPKFISNRTLQQPHNISTESGKQSRTLRNQSKNKSCFIPKHLVQSTESHLVCSNERRSQKYEKESQKYKSTAKNYSTENFNPNVSRKGLIQSKMTLPANMFSDTLNPLPSNNSMLYSCQPYLSLQAGENYPIKYQQNIPFQNPIIQFPNHPLPNIPPNNPLKEQLLEKQAKDMFLFKSKQLTKVLQQMHRFCISVNELKWICEQVCLLIKKYNHEISIFHEECLGEGIKRTDLENMLSQAEGLLKRFSQLAYLGDNCGYEKMFNFNLFIKNNANNANNNISNPLITSQQTHPKYQSNNSPLNCHSSSPQQNPHSWSKLIANLQQQQAPKPFPSNQAPLIPSEENSKNFTIRTFQITENNSPFKNKTLNQLIRLSELRKTQFETENKENSQVWANNFNNVENLNHEKKKNHNSNLNFIKNHPISYVPHQKSPSSQQKDPFDSIHLPHFSTKPPTKIQPTSLTKNQKVFNETQKFYYQQEITLLKKQLQNVEKENNEYFRKLRQKIADLEKRNEEIEKKLRENEKENDRLKERMTVEKDQFDYFEREVYILVERALNQLLNCGKVNSNNNFTINNNKSEGGLSIGYLEEIGRTRPIPRSQPSMVIGNKSFFQLINCLQQVFRVQNKDMVAKRTLPKQNIQYNNKFQIHQQKSIQLTNQIEQLEKIKSLLEKQIIKMQGKLESCNNSKTKSQLTNDYGLIQMMFAQAFTIEEMLQLNQSVNEQEEY